MRVEAAHIAVHTKEEAVRILTEALAITKEMGGGSVSSEALFAEASRLLSVRASVVQSVHDGLPDLATLGINTRAGL